VTRGAIVVALMLAAGLTAAAQDQSSTVADPRVNFKTLKTFTMGKATIASTRPELDNRLFEKKLTAAIRQALIAEGFTESATGADFVVTCSLKSEEIMSSARGVFRGQGPQPVRETAGVLEIGLSRPGEAQSGTMWKGVYREIETTGSKLVDKLPADARSLIAKIR
jgi:hypothetical protein